LGKALRALFLEEFPMPQPIPVPQPVPDATALRKAAIDATEKDLKASLKVGALTQAQQKVIADAVDSRLDSTIKRKAVTLASQHISGKSIAQSIQDLIGVQQTMQAAQLDQALKNNADILFRTYSQFKAAGFNDDQSFQLLLGQVKR
jgi:hypothetical protein